MLLVVGQGLWGHHPLSSTNLPFAKSSSNREPAVKSHTQQSYVSACRPQMLSRGTSAAKNTIAPKPEPPAGDPNTVPISSQPSFQPAVHAEPQPAAQQQQQQQQQQQAGLEHISDPWQHWKAPAAFATQSQQACNSFELPEDWCGPVTELVTYELELDTGQTQVSSSCCDSVPCSALCMSYTQ